MDVNWTYCGDHFVIYMNIKSLCCMPGANECNVVCQLYLNKKKKKKVEEIKKRKKKLCLGIYILVGRDKGSK